MVLSDVMFCYFWQYGLYGVYVCLSDGSGWFGMLLWWLVQYIICVDCFNGSVDLIVGWVGMLFGVCLFCLDESC